MLICQLLSINKRSQWSGQLHLIIPMWCAGNINVRGGKSSSDGHGFWRFHGAHVGLIHPIRGEICRRLCRKTGGWWCGRRRRKWITNMIQGEQIRSVSWRACSAAISTITQLVLSDFDSCCRNIQSVVEWRKKKKKRFGTRLSPNNVSVSDDVSLTLF